MSNSRLVEIDDLHIDRFLTVGIKAKNKWHSIRMSNRTLPSVKIQNYSPSVRFDLNIKHRDSANQGSVKFEIQYQIFLSFF